ncbi:hypothetical protein EHQ76_14745 [Leptospira barantonii]|uniref:Uncharacterized protein n=1 Tax=Leptospira barantonii TaxID=2023184 RepID=A0A5F2AZT3_9LEPT|nr:hypothetical protein EHQ76_14745 [Leptospira barantonii]
MRTIPNSPRIKETIWIGVILNLVSLMRSSGLDRGSVSNPSEFRQYFTGSPGNYLMEERTDVA